MSDEGYAGAPVSVPEPGRPQTNGAEPLPPRPPGPREQSRRQRKRWVWRGIAILMTVVLAVAAWEAYSYVRTTQAPGEVIVVATVRGEDGATVAGFAFGMNAAGGEARVIDILEKRTIPGSAVDTLRDAFPLGGPGVIAAAAQAEWGGSPREWISLEASAWPGLVDAAGGLDADTGNRIDVFMGRRLVTLRPGREHYTGVQAEALAMGLEYVDEPADRRAVQLELSEAVAEGLRVRPELAAAAFAAGDAASSLAPRQVSAFLESLEARARRR